MDDAGLQPSPAADQPARSWNARSDATWDAVRRDYLAGVPARDLCDRYAVARSTLRLKAKEGGWRRADQNDDDLFPAESDLAIDADEEDDWAALADRARFRLRRAIASGRAAEAASWLRIHERLRALVIAEAAALSGPPPAPAPEPDPDPDPLDAVMAMAKQVGSIARRAARVTDDAGFDALEAELEALEARIAARPAASDGPALDSLDSLDPVFSDPPAASPTSAPGDRPTDPRARRDDLLRLRDRRLGLGLGVSDLDQALAALDRTAAGDGLSP